MLPSLVTSPAALWTIPISLGTIVSAFSTGQHACPVPCNAHQRSWTRYSSMDKLNACNQPMFVDLSLNETLDAAEAAVEILACTLSDHSYPLSALSTGSTPSINVNSSCLSGQTTNVSLGLTINYNESSSNPDRLDSILEHVGIYLANTSHCDTSRVFASLNGISVGVYSGAAIDNVLTAPSILQDFRNRLSGVRRFTDATVQLCGADRDAEHTFGVAVDTTGNLAAVQKVVISWAMARCVPEGEINAWIEDYTIFEKPRIYDCRIEEVMFGDTCASLADRCGISPSEFMGYNSVNELCATLEPGQKVCCSGDAQSDNVPSCKAEKVVSGDSCASLAEKCGISAAEFIRYNPLKNLCATLQPGQRVCCSGNATSDSRPVAHEDGVCATYTTEPGDTCYSIAAAHDIDVLDISSFNDGTTWGWSGCDLLRPGLRICLSEGDPPLPAPVSNAVCGPTVPGTVMPTDGTEMADLNPCLLNACCNTLGQCGVTAEYCLPENGPTGNPGTAPPGRKGCISNCGTDVVNNYEEPVEFMRITYYESWNWVRPCLNLRAASIDASEYTHIHWGFGTVNRTFHVGVNDTYNQWNDFLALPNVKKILSFGGWGYSIDTAAYDVLREALDPKNVDTFIENIVQFVGDNGLDGVDFDWEYPGASDLHFTFVPTGRNSDGANYLEFLKKIKKAIPEEKSISIAAPASYWYLKLFPIEELSHLVDYIVYMTYDFHGQWEHGSELAQLADYCATGNCLRSHVNLTETEYALAMITKAGVPSNKVTVGVTSYGRAFGMTDADCSGPECTFEGPESRALLGVCTRTEGILANAEIEEIIDSGAANRNYYDEGSDSNILVYNNTQWVSYMDEETKGRRIEYYRSLNFGGYADWAVDMAYWSGDDGKPNGPED